MRHPGRPMRTPVPPPGPGCRRFELLLPLFSPAGLLDDGSPETEALREHIESCEHCRTLLTLYDVQARSLRHSYWERIAASPSFAADIVTYIEEDPFMSQITPDSTPEQSAATPLLSTSDSADIARRRLEAARLTLRPPKRPVVAVARWLAPLAAVLLIAILAAAFFAAGRTGRSAATPPPSLPYSPGIGFEITAMSMTSPNEGWAVVQSFSFGTSNSPLPQELLHDHNGTWSPVTLSTTAPLADISMVSATDGWAVGADGLILHYDGHSWKSVASPTIVSLDSVRMLSATQGWASGDSAASTDTPLILHYDGHNWVTEATPTLALAPANWPESWSTASIQAEPDGEVWALTTWQLALDGAVPPGAPPPNLSGSAILHFDGSHWQVQTSMPGIILGGLSMDSSQDGWATGSQQHGASRQEVYYHFSHGRWELTPLTVPSSGGTPVMPLYGKVAMVAPGNGWMLGVSTSNLLVGWVLHLSQERLQLAALPTLGYHSPDGWGLLGIYFQPDGSGWAFGSASKTITPKGKAAFISWVPLLLRYSGGVWSVQLD